MKTLVVFYSWTGSNRYIASKIAQRLDCEIEEIRPRLNLFMFFLMKISFGIRPLKKKINDFDKIILCGPIWMGKFVTPLSDFIKKYTGEINQLIFVTCCGSGYEVKDEKFGHALVFEKVKNLLGDKCLFCEALPIGLVLPDDKKSNNEAIMNTRLTDANFKGEIEERLWKFVDKVDKVDKVDAG